MFSKRIQQQARRLVTLLIQPLAQWGITPNMLTGIGLLLSVVTALVIAQGHMFLGGLLVLFAGIFDMFDGAMARVRDSATTFGAFLDSTLDRYSESIILFGLLLYTLQHPGLKDSFWPAPNEQTWMILFIFAAMCGSLMVSYTKARAEGLGIECKTGMLARPERVVLLAIGLLLNAGIWVLALLAVFTQVTALERIIAVWRNTRPLASASVNYQQQDTSANDQTLPTIGINETIEPDVRSVPTNIPPLGGGVHPE